MQDRYLGYLSSDVYGIGVDEARIGCIHLTAAQAAASGVVHAAITGSATVTVTTTANITNPPCPRNLVITPGGITTDVKAGNVTVIGTNIAGQVISEDFAFAASATGATVGVKAFKTVTSIVIPTQGGAGATFAVAFGDKIGLPYKLTSNTVIHAVFGAVKETTAPTVAVDADELEKNTVTLNSALDGTAVDIYLLL